MRGFPQLARYLLRQQGVVFVAREKQLSHATGIIQPEQRVGAPEKGQSPVIEPCSDPCYRPCYSVLPEDPYLPEHPDGRKNLSDASRNTLRTTPEPHATPHSLMRVLAAVNDLLRAA